MFQRVALGEALGEFHASGDRVIETIGYQPFDERQ
jgi:hypothetical protein